MSQCIYTNKADSMEKGIINKTDSKMQKQLYAKADNMLSGDVKI